MKGKALLTKEKPTMQTPYVEQNCTVHYAGRDFNSGGAVVSDVYAIAYIGNDKTLTDWHGRVLGTYKIVAAWRITPGPCAEKMYQIEGTINGVLYTGRSMGTGMIWRGKRKAVQPR